MSDLGRLDGERRRLPRVAELQAIARRRPLTEAELEEARDLKASLLGRIDQLESEVRSGEFDVADVQRRIEEIDHE